MNNFPLTALPFLGSLLAMSELSSVFRLNGRGTTPHASSRPTLTIGKRQMSQKHRANRRKASAKARRR